MKPDPISTRPVTPAVVERLAEVRSSMCMIRRECYETMRRIDKSLPELKKRTLGQFSPAGGLQKLEQTLSAAIGPLKAALEKEQSNRTNDAER